MKTVFLFLGFFLLVGNLSLAQQSQKMCFDYDEAGNRITRMILTMSRARRSAVNPDDDKISNTLLACKVTVYPNPTDGEVTLSISGGEEEGISSIGLYDGSGQLLKTFEAKGNVSVPIDLSSYVDGIYLINFSQGDSKSFYKVIKH